MSVIQTRKEKDFEQFVRALPKLEPIEFYGLAKLLGASCEEDKLDETLEKMMDRFLGLKKHRRREILQILKDVRGAKNGTTT